MLNFTTSLLAVIHILKPAGHNSQKSQPKISALYLCNHVMRTVLLGEVNDLTKRKVGHRARGKLVLSHGVNGKCKQL